MGVMDWHPGYNGLMLYSQEFGAKYVAWPQARQSVTHLGELKQIILLIPRQVRYQ